MLLITCHLTLIREKTHEPTRGVLVGVHEPTHQPDQSTCHHRRPFEARLYPCIDINEVKNPNFMTEIVEVKRDNTGEVADDDGDAGDGGETEVIEGVEVADHRGEWWVSIYNWVLWLLRGCDVRVHSVAACVNRLLLLVVPWHFQVSTPE